MPSQLLRFMQLALVIFSLSFCLLCCCQLCFNMLPPLARLCLRAKHHRKKVLLCRLRHVGVRFHRRNIQPPVEWSASAAQQISSHGAASES